MFDPSWNPGDGRVVFPLLGGAAAYAFMHYVLSSDNLERWTGGSDPKGRGVLLEHAAGGLWLGLVSMAIGAGVLSLDARELLIWTDTPERILLVAAVNAVVLVPIVAMNMQRASSWAWYPEAKWDWTPQRKAADAACWVVYLLGYELFFRGLLLGALEPALGTWPAIAAMGAFYTIAHLPKFAGETAGTIPIGIAWAMATMWSGSFVTAWLCHSTVAIAGDLFAIRAQSRVGFPATERGP